MRAEIRTNARDAGEILVSRIRSNRIALVTPDYVPDGHAIVSTRVFVGTPALNGTGVLVLLDANGEGSVTVYAANERVFHAAIVGASVTVAGEQTG